MNLIRAFLQRTILPLDLPNLTKNIWGGNWIAKLKKMDAKNEPIGESWEFSAHPSRPTRIRLPKKRIMPLNRVLSQYGNDVLGEKMSRRFRGQAPFILKFIDAQDDLSVQVHPTKSYARKHEKDREKWESWYIVDAGKRKSEGFIYLGFSTQFSQKNELRRKFKKTLNRVNAMGPSRFSSDRKKASDQMLPFLNKIRVRPGEVYDIPPGTIHAIGKGVRVFEIQQSSNMTYRLWDWNRPDSLSLEKGKCIGRKLHLREALAVLNWKSGYRRIKKKEGLLIKNKTPAYALEKILLRKRGDGRRLKGGFSVVTVLKGSVQVGADTVNRGYSACIPAKLTDVQLIARGKDTEILRSFVP